MQGFYLKSGGTLLCTAKVPPQSGLEGIGLTNSGEGAERGVAVAAEVKGVKYEYAGGVSCPSEVRTDGVIAGEGTLAGADESEDQVGVHLTGNEFLPRIEAESYGATLTGGGLKTFTTKAGYVECGESGLEGVAGNATSGLTLEAQYGGCTANSSKFFSTVAMNGCEYELGVKNAGPPYAGILGIDCGGGGPIELKVYTKAGGSLLCTTRIGSQAGLEGMALSSTGEGASRSIVADAELKGVKYEQSGIGCAKETRTDGVISGKATLSGEDDSEAQIGSGWAANRRRGAPPADRFPRRAGTSSPCGGEIRGARSLGGHARERCEGGGG